MEQNRMNEWINERRHVVWVNFSHLFRWFVHIKRFTSNRFCFLITLVFFLQLFACLLRTKSITKTASIWLSSGRAYIWMFLFLRLFVLLFLPYSAGKYIISKSRAKSKMEIFVSKWNGFSTLHDVCMIFSFLAFNELHAHTAFVIILRWPVKLSNSFCSFDTEICYTFEYRKCLNIIF